MGQKDLSPRGAEGADVCRPERVERVQHLVMSRWRMVAVPVQKLTTATTTGIRFSAQVRIAKAVNQLWSSFPCLFWTYMGAVSSRASTWSSHSGPVKLVSLKAFSQFRLGFQCGAHIERITDRVFMGAHRGLSAGASEIVSRQQLHPQAASVMA